MENRSLPIGFIIKQVNNVYEKDLNERLKKIGITSSQCAVLDYLFHTSKDEVSQRDVEKNLNLKNPTVTGILKRLDEKGYIFCVPNANDRRKKIIYLTEKAYDIRRKMDSICDFDFIAFDNPWICIDFIVSIFPKKCKAMGCQNEDGHISFVDCRSLL